MNQQLLLGVVFIMITMSITMSMPHDLRLNEDESNAAGLPSRQSLLDQLMKSDRLLLDVAPISPLAANDQLRVLREFYQATGSDFWKNNTGTLLCRLKLRFVFSCGTNEYNMIGWNDPNNEYPCGRNSSDTKNTWFDKPLTSLIAQRMT
jgi:hypothetical protein